MPARTAAVKVSPYSHSVGKASHNWAGAVANKYLATDRNGQPAKSYAGGYTYDLFQPDARAYAWNAMQKGWVEQYVQSTLHTDRSTRAAPRVGGRRYFLH